jgi:hypothetical protein
MTTKFSLDLISIFTYCGSIIPDKLGIIHYSIIIISSGILIHFSNRWIKIIINGVERTVLATASGIVINNTLGRPIPLPNLGRANRSENQGNNPSNNSGNQGSNPGNTP